MPGAFDPDSHWAARLTLARAARGRVASFKIPRHVWLVEELPMTSSGKVRQAVLRGEARRRLAGA